jgi:hypothetical protein
MAHLVAFQKGEDFLDPVVLTAHHFVQRGEPVAAAANKTDGSIYVLDAEAEHDGEGVSLWFR